MSVGDLLALEPGAAERFQEHWLGYTESLGSPALRHEIAGLYEHDRTRPGAGARRGRGGDLPLYARRPRARRPPDRALALLPVPLRGRAGHRLRGHALGGARGERVGARPGRAARPAARTRGPIVVNLPHNPTGYLMPAARPSASWHDLARERRLAALVRRGLPRVGVRPGGSPARGLRPGRRTPSRWASSPRPTAWPGCASAGSPPTMPSCTSAWRRSRTTPRICNSAPSEFLAELALRHRERLAARNLAIIRTNLDLLDAFFARHADRFAWQRPRAGSIAFPELLGDAHRSLLRRPGARRQRAAPARHDVRPSRQPLSDRVWAGESAGGAGAVGAVFGRGFGIRELGN